MSYAPPCVIFRLRPTGVCFTIYCSLFLVLLLMSALFFFLMIRRPPRSTLDRSSAASDVYKRQGQLLTKIIEAMGYTRDQVFIGNVVKCRPPDNRTPVSYTHLRAHETVLDLVCRLLLEKKKTTINNAQTDLNLSHKP